MMTGTAATTGWALGPISSRLWVQQLSEIISVNHCKAHGSGFYHHLIWQMRKLRLRKVQLELREEYNKGRSLPLAPP
jgi:hypothetical protein